MNGVMFGNKHSYRDWGLLLKSRPVISPPSPKNVYIDVPGSDGSLDLTEALTGDVKYENRKIKLVFWVLDARKRWSDIYSEILDFLHGQQMRITFDEDPTYYYYAKQIITEIPTEYVRTETFESFRNEINSKVSSVYHVKGSVADYASLPTMNDIGDVYNLLDTGANYVWTSDGWDKLSETIDLSNYVKRSAFDELLSRVENLEKM